ncbi:MAG: AmmeMemoRadiSam system radical SAM enzyme [Bacteroidia bacterium]|nr:AmmeMemoRadiSam system radical SAM enzyme [Bacteroidia bacterium]
MNKREFIRNAAVAGISTCLCGIDGFGNITLSTMNDQDKLKPGELEARHWLETPRGIKCMICPNECTLKEGELSVCHNRIAREGKLYTMAYGNPCAVNVDPVEKKPLLHFLPGSLSFSIATAGCNFACLNCQNWEISQTSPTQTRNFDAKPEKVVSEAIREQCKSIAYTYSEPTTFFEYMIDTATLAKHRGIKNIMVSNGYINQEPLLELCKVIDAANIDLKTFDPVTHLKLTAGKLDPVLASLKTFKDQGVWLEITNLIIPDWTDNFDQITKMCDWLAKEGFADYPLHFSRFHPMHKLTRLPATPLQALTRAKDIALKAGMKFVYIGNVPGIGGEDTYCPNCKCLLVKRRGFEIEQNLITSNRCPKCQSGVAGRW